MRLVILMIFVCAFTVGCNNVTVIRSRPAMETKKHIKPSKKIVSNNHSEQGKKLFFKGKHKQAAKHFVRAISNNPNNWEAHYYLGLCQQKAGHHNRAIVSFEKGLNHAPPNKRVIAEIMFCSGYSLEQIGQYRKAEKKYSLSLKTDPSYIDSRKGIKRTKAKLTKAEAKQKKDKHHKKGRKAY